jgi:4,5-DOPA dioxygenase extradiol
MPRPRAIRAISAQCCVGSSALTAMARPRTIHDFYGFPTELGALEYPAPGAPEIAEEIADVVKPRFVGLDHDAWGIDHGTWSVLVHMFPAADIPVLQLSLNATERPDDHVDLGARLAPLRERGIFVLGSGNVVHNLRRLDLGRGEAGFDWAVRFDEAARALMTGRPGDAAELTGHPDFAASAPTPDHFLPLLYLAGLCDRASRPATVVVDGYFAGGIAMTSFALGVEPAGGVAAGGPAASLPDPAVVPPGETNA